MDLILVGTHYSEYSVEILIIYLLVLVPPCKDLQALMYPFEELLVSSQQ